MTFFHNLPNYGYISEVNLEYSKGLHNLDNTYRYAPEKICMVDTNNWKVRTLIADLSSKKISAFLQKMYILILIRNSHIRYWN